MFSSSIYKPSLNSTELPNCFLVVSILASYPSTPALFIKNTLSLKANILLMAEILHQLIGSLSHHFWGFIHPRWWSPDFWTINRRTTKWEDEISEIGFAEIQPVRPRFRWRSHHPALLKRWKLGSKILGGSAPPPNLHQLTSKTIIDTKWRTRL